MRDSLKEHIEENIEEFEQFPFDEKQGWVDIADKVITPTKKKGNIWVFGVAASLAIIFISTVLVITGSQTEKPNELAEVENFYQEEINQKVKLVKSQLEDDRILADLEAMDEAFSELKADLDENVHNEEVVVAMMENYRLKLEILEEILKELEKEKGESSL